MIANASPIVIVRCMDSHGREKNCYPTRKAARKWGRGSACTRTDAMTTST